MGEIIDELEDLGYVERHPDPTDRRAKLITLTDRGVAAVEAGEATIVGIEDDILAILGPKRYHELRGMLMELLASPPQPGD